MDELSRKQIEYAVLCGLNSPAFSPDEAVDDLSLQELEELLKTAGGECVARMIQNRATPEPKTLLGTGKALELKELCEENHATLVVFDNELTPAQTRNLEEIIGVRVIDRSTLILDIFASRAQTREGKLQVELAQYQYILPRLTGKGLELSRLGGGIGTRGPGESKLETDRRHIRRHISKLKEELNEVRRNRDIQRRARQKKEIPSVAIVGYTNAGKSTLLNTLTGAGIHANNRLFDTLDPTVRAWRVSDTLEVVLSDTVGFIRKLPHHLVDAFRATLEELKYADLLLHVIDSSDENYPAHARVVAELISELDAAGKPCITVFNKIDLCRDRNCLPRDDETVWTSARSGDGMDELTQAVARILDAGRCRLKLLIPYSDAGNLDVLHREAKVMSKEYTPDGILIDAVCDARLGGRLKKYISSDSEV